MRISNAPLVVAILSMAHADDFDARDVAIDPRSEIFTEFLHGLPAVLDGVNVTGLNATMVGFPPCGAISSIQTKIKNLVNSAFDELAEKLEEAVPRVGGAQCHFQITELSDGPWPCLERWTLTFAELNGKYSDTEHFSPTDIVDAMYRAIAGVVNQFDTRFEDLDCLSRHKLLRLIS